MTEIPIEIVNKILMFRGIHPLAKILKEPIKKYRIEFCSRSFVRFMFSTCYVENCGELASYTIHAWIPGEDEIPLIDYNYVIRSGYIGWEDYCHFCDNHYRMIDSNIMPCINFSVLEELCPELDIEEIQNAYRDWETREDMELQDKEGHRQN